jgi:hypothetical protein
VRRSFLILAVLLPLAVTGCPDIDQDLAPGQRLGKARSGSRGETLIATDRSVQVQVMPHASLPKSARLLFIGFSAAQTDGDHPRKGTTPAFYWKSDKLRFDAPLSLIVPLPEAVNLLVVIDSNNDGRPAPDERSSRLLLNFEGKDGASIRIDRAFADLGGPGRDGPVRDVVIDATRLDGVKGKVRPLILGFEEDGLRNGMPSAGSIPTFLWVGDETVFADSMTLRAPLPAGGMDVLLMLDTDGDGLPSPDEPISAAVEDFSPPADGSPWNVVLDRLFKPSRVDGNTGPVAAGGDGDGKILALQIDATPRIQVKDVSLMFVGYDDEDLSGGKPMSDASPSFFWRTLQPTIKWPLSVEARVPGEGSYFVVVDLDGDRQASVGDLSSALVTSPDPKTVPASAEVTLDRTLTFADSDEGDGKEDGG